jgi:uncharacterized iron-regulated protein
MDLTKANRLVLKRNQYKYCLIFVSMVLSCCFFLKACTSRPTEPFLKVSAKKYMSLEDVIFETSTSDLIFVGEHHDNIHHHINQLQIIRELHEKAQVQLAIGLEMFERKDQYILDNWTKGQLETEEFIKYFYKNWREPWPLYRDIFIYAKEHQIPLVGLNVPDEIVKKVAKNGYTSLTDEDLSRLPYGITCNVSDQYKDHIEKVFHWHDSKNSKSFANFCEAQVLWDTAMAINLLDFHEKNNDETVVVLAGSTHAWKPGIPAQVLERKKVSTSIILPEDRDLHRRNVSVEETDYMWLWQMI